MSTDDDSKSFPKSVRHRQILDVAAEHPDASVGELASMVPSATPELVERVFEKHGDPATGNESAETPGDAASDGGEADSSDESGDGPATSVSHAETEVVDGTPTNDREETDTEPMADVIPSLEDLSEKQREVLTAVAKRPDATQREIGEQLDVSATTVSNRINSIEGFEWSDRASLVESVFGERPSSAVTADGGAGPESVPSDESQVDSVETRSDDAQMSEIESRIEGIEERLAELEATRAEIAGDDGEMFPDPELVHKVAHACLDSEAISEAEELRILEALLE